MNWFKVHFPGILITFILALGATEVVEFLPDHIIGPGVLTLFIGMILHPLIRERSSLSKGITYSSKGLLRLGIILMGANFSFAQVVQVGGSALSVMAFTLLTAFGGGALLGKLLGLDWKLSSLISAGTGICGGSAITAVAPVIDAEDDQVAYAISTIFLFDMLMVLLLPLIGGYLQLSDLTFGLWAGTAINDTSSVVASSYGYSSIAGDYAVIVKLTRTLAIIPVVLFYSTFGGRPKEGTNGDTVPAQGNSGGSPKVSVAKIFPWFVLIFLAMVVLKTLGIIPTGLTPYLSKTSKFLMVMALGAIGLKTNPGKLVKSGVTPLVHGLILSTLVILVSFFAIQLLAV